MANIDLIGSFPSTQLACASSSLSAVQHVRPLSGATQAHLMRASDNRVYAVKFQNNPQSARALASEFLATRLGAWLGLPMAQVEVIDVSDWLVNHDLLRVETDHRLTRCASGRQLGLRYLQHTFGHRLQESFGHVTNKQDFVRALPFDKWTANCDNRQAVFVRHGKRKHRVVFIDQHNCFNAGRWTFPDLLHHGTYEDGQLYADVTGWQSFEPTLSRIEKISRFDLWKFATEIPSEWYQHDTGALSRLIERLYRRRSSVRGLIGKFRMSDINPFPHWKETEEIES